MGRNKLLYIKLSNKEKYDEDEILEFGNEPLVESNDPQPIISCHPPSSFNTP